MNVFILELKAHRKSLIIWSLAMILMATSGMAKFATAANTKSMTEIIDQMPKALQTVFGLSGFDITTVIGSFGVMFFYLLIMATIHAVMLGAGIISKEERDKTTEFLMVKPISRDSIITAKLLAALFNVVVINAVTFISSAALINYYGKGDTHLADLTLLMVAMLILQIMFMLIGTAVAALSKKPKTAPALATTILLITYVLSMLIDLSDKLSFLKFLTPFKYFEAKNLINGGSFDPIFVGLSLIIIGVMVSLTYVCYRKRDLNV